MGRCHFHMMHVRKSISHTATTFSQNFPHLVTTFSKTFGNYTISKTDLFTSTLYKYITTVTQYILDIQLCYILLIFVKY